MASPMRYLMDPTAAQVDNAIHEAIGSLSELIATATKAKEQLEAGRENPMHTTWPQHGLGGNYYLVSTAATAEVKMTEAFATMRTLLGMRLMLRDDKVVPYAAESPAQEG